MAKTFSESLEKIAPWGILGFTVTFVGVLISIAIFYFQESSAKVHAGWWVRNEEKLVEVRETMKDLRILYRGQDMLESGKELRILTLEFVNEGKDITQQMFDRNLDVGLCFANSEIITSQVTSVSSKYLADNLKSQVRVTESSKSADSSNTGQALILPKLVFDHGSAFSVKVYFLQSIRAAPTEVTCLGKISGVETLKITATPRIRPARSGVWIALVTGLASSLLGTAIYALGLRQKANRQDRDHILEALRQELREVTQNVPSKPE